MTTATGRRATDVVEVSDLIRTLRQQWRAVAVCVAIGVLAALAVLLFAPRRFEGKATVLARPAAASGGSILGRLGGGVGDLIGNMSGLGGGKADFETELQVLKSRELAGRLVDSLQLQVQMRHPTRVPPVRVANGVGDMTMWGVSVRCPPAARGWC